MRVLVIDDDLKSCELIKRSLEKDFKKAVVECYDFLPDIENLSDDYDLIFLDIVFDHHNGIDYSKQLKKRLIEPNIVFISNQKELIFQTQEVSPLCFIRKSAFDYDYAVFKGLFEEKGKTRKTYTFELDKSANKQKISQIKLVLDNIVYVECYMHELIIHTQTEEYVSKITLKDFLELVQDKECFIQIHRSYAVNMNYIYSVDTHRVFMMNEDSQNVLEIGRTYKKEFKKKFQEFV